MSFWALRLTANVIKLIGFIAFAFGVIQILQGLGELSSYARNENVFGVVGSIKLYLGAASIFWGLLAMAFGQLIDVLIETADNSKIIAETNNNTLALVQAFAARMAVKVEDAVKTPPPPLKEDNFDEVPKANLYRDFAYRLEDNGDVIGDTPEGRFRFKSVRHFKDYIDKG
jgi:hypothetical protein